MRALILADAFFAAREQALLQRIEVGLVDEGLRVVHAVPETATAYAPGDMISSVVTYQERTWRFARGAAARRLAKDLRAAAQGDEPGRIDVIHVFGGTAWALAVDLAREVGAALALEVWRIGLAPGAAVLASRASPAPLFIAPDATIERALVEQGEVEVRRVLWGVHTPPMAKEILAPGRAVSAMMIGTGRDARAFSAALEGLASVVRRFPDFMIFCDAQAARRANLYPLARRLGILDHLSMIGELEGRRDLVLQGDLLIQPDARGEQKSVTLDAMAQGMIVVAAEDRAVTALIDGRTARLVRGGAAEWGGAVGAVLDDRARALALAESARAYVREHRRASDQVRGVLDAYASIVSAGAIPFSRPGRV